MPDIDVNITEQTLHFSVDVAQIPADQVAIIERLKQSVTTALQTTEAAVIQTSTDKGVVSDLCTQVQQQAASISQQHQAVTDLAEQAAARSEQVSETVAQSQQTITMMHDEVAQAWSGINSATDKQLQKLSAETTRLTRLVTRGTADLHTTMEQSEANLAETYRVLKSIDGVDRLVQSQVNIAEAHADDADKSANASAKETSNCQGYVGQCQSLARKVNRRIAETDNRIVSVESQVSAAQQALIDAEKMVNSARDYALQAERQVSLMTTMETKTREALVEFTRQAGSIRTEMQQLNSDVTESQSTHTRTMEARQAQLQLNVAAQCLPLSVSLIKTQALITSYHAFH